MDARLHGIEAVFFDAYGTLFDVHSPVARLAPKLGARGSEISALWRRKQLEYTWLRSLMGAHADFWRVTSEALDYALEAHGLDDPELAEELMQLYLKLDAYPDARPTLEQVKQAGRPAGILSNGSPAMLAAAVNSAGLDAYLDHVISVEEAGVYKPHPSVYRLALSHAGIGRPDAVCFVSANTWDAQAAAKFGFQVVRIDRFGWRDERIPGRASALLASLTDLPRLLG